MGKKETYEEALALIRQGVYDAEVARRTGYTRERIRQLRVQMGLPLSSHYFSYVDAVLKYSTDQEFMKKLRAYWEDERCYNDKQIARFLQVSPELIGLLREKFKIPAHWKRVEALLLPYLEKRMDTELAHQFGLSVIRVAGARKRLGIPSYRARKMQFLSSKAFRDALGKMYDKEVAQQFGVHVNTVVRYRKRLGIPSFHPAMRKRELMSQKAFLEALGKMLDRAVARQFGVSKSAVQRYRTRLGIPPVYPRRRTEELMSQKAFLEALGKMLDRAVARQFGVSVSTVQKYRTRLGIPAYKSQKK